MRMERQRRSQSAILETPMRGVEGSVDQMSPPHSLSDAYLLRVLCPLSPLPRYTHPSPLVT